MAGGRGGGRSGGGGREGRMRRRVEGMLVDGRRGKEGREGNAKKRSGEKGMEKNKGKTKWKEELQKTVGWRLTKSKNKERDYCLHNSLGTRLVYIVTINCSTA